MCFQLVARTGEDFARTAEEWAQKVNGKSIFPKLPAHLRIYHKTWDFNSKLKASLKEKGVAFDDLRARLEADVESVVVPPPKDQQPIPRPLPPQVCRHIRLPSSVLYGS